MTNKTERVNIQLPASLKWLLVGGCSLVLLILLGGLAAWFFLTRGGGGEPATTHLAERVTKEFVQALQTEDREAIYRTFSDQVRPNLSKDGLGALVNTTTTWAVLKTYQNLEICDWQLIMRNDGRHLLAQGLLYHENGNIVFDSDLIQDSDTIWRIYGFGLEPKREAKPFGHCK